MQYLFVGIDEMHVWNVNILKVSPYDETEPNPPAKLIWAMPYESFNIIFVQLSHPYERKQYLWMKFNIAKSNNCDSIIVFFFCIIFSYMVLMGPRRQKVVRKYLNLHTYVHLN